jgi:protein-S-isoprenylcysteine O-methyltransferase Ste14
MIFSILRGLTFVFWGILFVNWFISAFSAKKSSRGKKWWWRQLVIRVVFFVIVLFFFRIGTFNHNTFNFFYQSAEATQSSVAIGIIGVIICAAGVAFAIWARAYLGTNWGMPMTLQEGHKLVTSGPYKFVRHPIYTGFVFAMLGSACTDGAMWLILLVFLGIYFTYSAKVEEGIMLKQFPDEYPAYMKKTKMFVPFIL